MASITVELKDPFQFGRDRITSVTLREPKFAEITRIPEPVSVMRFENGATSYYIAPEVVREWIEALSDIDPNALDSLSRRDTIKLRTALLSFFHEERTEEQSPKPAPSPDNSSSDSASPLTQ